MFAVGFGFGVEFTGTAVGSGASVDNLADIYWNDADWSWNDADFAWSN